ncbi:hypothetical protein CEH05_08480 [Halobacillus halophilus]|uniref:Uncharacterized protein n=2 Tax=Halobacillus halophilus TaxID=1570 RepID=I0JLM4_HALH3|nr:hypothetical protein CEH05_08480 [Halobacillus halophilus]CCG45044.1 hypothetical protein HBHAL_2694 [Halobacillus halophilus DSM 2266]
MFFGSTSWGVFVWFMVMVIALWAWSIKYKKTNGKKEGAWWNWLLISFVALIHFTDFHVGLLYWEYPHEREWFSLIGWWISLLTVSGLLLYKWIHEEDVEALKQENERLREAVEYYRNKQENDD